jgi:hypothetical protein
MTQSASLREFLRTGRLGPLTTELGPNEVGELLGAPDAWLISGTLPFPDYWAYGKLEIRFREEDSHPDGVAMDFFQIETAHGLEGDNEVISNSRGPVLVIDLEGLDGNSGIAALLDAMSGCENVKITIERPPVGEDYVLFISNGPVEVVMSFETGEEPENEHRKKSDAEVARLAARAAELDSIYSYAPRKSPAPQPNPDWERRTMTMADFLTAIAES